MFGLRKITTTPFLALALLAAATPTSATPCLTFKLALQDSLVYLSSHSPGPVPTDNDESLRLAAEFKRHKPEVVAECLGDEGTPGRTELIYLLQGFFERVGTDESGAEWVDSIGLRDLFERVGLTRIPSEERTELTKRLEANNNRWDELETQLVQVMKNRGKLEATTRRVSIRLFSYQAIITATLLGHLVYQEVIPEKYCTPTGLLALCGLVGAQSIGLSKVAWPRWRDTLLKILAPRQFARVVEAFNEVIELNPQQGIPYLLELATIHGQPPLPALSGWGSVNERAARQCLIKSKRPEAAPALIALSIRYLESGYLDAGIELLDEVLKRLGNDPATTQLALAVKEAVNSKNQFEIKLGALKRGRLFWRVLGTIGVLGGGSLGVSYFRVDPVWLATLQSTLLSLAGAIGMGKVVSYVWLRYPTEPLRQKLGGEIEALRATFHQVTKLNPDVALPFLEGIASPDENTHPFIREAAFLAILDSDHPSVTRILERIAQANIRIRGSLSLTETILRKVIERYRNCNHRIAAMGLE